MSARTPLWRWAWRELSIHPYLKALYLAFYLGAIYIGCAALFAPPTSIEVEIGPFLTAVWGCLSLVAGFFGAWAVLPGWWWVERVCVILAVIALVLYLGTVIYLQITSPGNRWAQTGLFWFGLAGFAIRYFQVRKFNYEPKVRP